ncbi:hypothetical protein J6590_006279 [Homalodisca vitripennis]|nr:hypothetical protein J6590_006279 [Homalodisca vitripennis]
MFLLILPMMWSPTNVMVTSNFYFLYALCTILYKLERNHYRNGVAGPRTPRHRHDTSDDVNQLFTEGYTAHVCAMYWKRRANICYPDIIWPEFGHIVGTYRRLRSCSPHNACALMQT